MNTQSQSQGFLNAIIDNPDDDLPRLVFADYLEEAGASERAEFIRIQCELAAGVGDPARQKSLEDRQSELLAKHMEAWRVPIRGHQKFERGFVDSLWASADNLLHASSEIITSSTVRTLRISNADQRIDDLAEYPGFRNIEHLDLTNNNLSGDYRLRAILGNPHLGKLRGLNLHNNRIWADDVLRIARSPVAKQLTHLDLSGNGIGNDGVGHLANEAAFTNIEVLNLRSDGLPEYECIDEDGMRRFSMSSNLYRLGYLDIAGHRIRDEGFKILATSGWNSSLKRLDVSYNRIGYGDYDAHDAILSLIESANLLQELDFSGNSLHVEFATMLIELAGIDSIKRISLQKTEMPLEARHLLQSSEYAQKFVLDEKDVP